MRNKNNSLGGRMKGYENVSRICLTGNLPVIIRIDGKAFHTFTRDFALPRDPVFAEAMARAAKYLCENVAGCKLAYIQSDEISLLTFGEPWFDNNLQKLVSVAASMATLSFNDSFRALAAEAAAAAADEKLCAAYKRACASGATFDARAFVLPKEDVLSYFIWRQQDATRNSILSLAQSEFEQAELQGKKCNALQDMLFTRKGINWNDRPAAEKRGVCAVRAASVEGREQWIIDREIPVFTRNKAYIEKLLRAETR